MESKILIIDDNKEITDPLVSTLKLTLNYDFLIINSDFENIPLNGFSVAIVDLNLVPYEGISSGFRIIEKILSISPATRVIVLTGERVSDAGVKALSLGASSFLTKPVDIPHLIELIKDAVKVYTLKIELIRKNGEGKNLNKGISSHIIGKSSKVLKIIDDIVYAGSNDLPVLITGETGTGKGLVAKTIHTFSKFSDGKFIPYHPSFMSADIINSDLFGHKKGSFTGAIDTRQGLIAESSNGTLFLDEIDELPINIQITLLRFLQEKKFRKIGSDIEQVVNTRIIVATNKDISESIAKGKIREDLFHRISAIKIHIPSLRERPEDIKILADFFLQRVNENEGKCIYSFSDDVYKSLEQNKWNGNIRELQSVVQSSFYMARFKGRSFISIDDLRIDEEVEPKKVNNALRKSKSTNFSYEDTSDTNIDLDSSDLSNSNLLQKYFESCYKQKSLTNLVEEIKSKLVDYSLKINQNNQSKASKDLQIDRTTLRRILNKESL